MQCLEHTGLKLEINNRKITGKAKNMLRLNKTLLNNTWVKADISKEILKHNDPKPMGCSKSNSKRDVYSNTILPQETRKISNT